MKLDLIHNAHLWHRFWSVRFLFVAALFEVLGDILPAFMEVIPRWPFSLLTFASTVGAFVARFILQPELSDADQ